MNHLAHYTDEELERLHDGHRAVMKDELRKGQHGLANHHASQCRELLAEMSRRYLESRESMRDQLRLL